MNRKDFNESGDVVNNKGKSKLKKKELFSDDRDSFASNTKESLGILSMDDLKAFGEESSCTSSQASDTSINDRLLAERIKALRMLESFPQSDRSTFKTPANNPLTNKKHKTPGLDRTDYVPYRRYDSINISDLVTEKTIELQSSNQNTPINKISFEPSEITARSTSVPTVEQILATSFSNKVRNLRESLRESYSSGGSLPRTADISNISSKFTSFQSLNKGKNSLTFENCHRTDETGFSGENFIPGENMNSKLAADEYDWEQEFADIPTTKKRSSNVNKSTFSYNKSNSIISNSNESRMYVESDFSIGNFFNKRCENLLEMIPAVSPNKKNQPYALLDDTYYDTNALNQVPVRDASTRKVDDKTYNKTHSSALSINDSEMKKSQASSKKSPNSSYLLSVSDIANALNDIDTSDSANTMVDRLLNRGKVRSYIDASSKTLENVNDNFSKSITNKNSDPHILENKENINPQAKGTFQLSDTVSFTESLLDCSEYRKLNEQSNFDNSNPPNMLETTTEQQKEDPFAQFRNENITKNTLKVPKAGLKRRKRSHSSYRAEHKNDSDLEVTPIRRSKSPSTTKELSAASGSNAVTSPFNKTLEKKKTASPLTSPQSFNSQLSSPRYCSSSKSQSPSMDSTLVSNRIFQIDSTKSPVDFGKFSLPSYGLATKNRSPSPCPLKSRCSSQCSSSSEFSHRDGKLPLKATCSELSWGSIKLRKTVKKTFQIKNISNKRLPLRVEVSGPGFQIANSENSNILTLHGQECRTLALSFCPTVIGAAVGRLTFHPPYEQSNALQTIALNGYGGHACIIPQGILKGPVGSAFLTMGELQELSQPLEKTFVLYNKGPLAGFACINVDSARLDHPRLCDSIEIIPNKVLIQPESYIRIRIIFKPRRDDVKKLIKKISEVMTLANLRIFCGDEPTRQRIRHLISQMKQTDKSKISTNSLEKLWKDFPHEHDVVGLASLKEKSDVAIDLISTLRTHEITLTLNHSNINETADTTLMFPDVDETVMFRTIISNSSFSQSTDRQDIPSVESWSVRPTYLEIEPYENRYMITVCSNFSKSKYYEVDTNYRHLFTFTPQVGQLDPGEEVQVEAIFRRTFIPSELAIMIYVENNKITIPVKIKKESLTSHFR